MENILFIPTNHFPSLTHLILVGTKYFRPIGPYTFDNFLLFLSRCPKLEVLHFFALDMARFDEIPGGRPLAPLKLPHLRKFSNEDVLLDLTRDYEFPYYGPDFRQAILQHIKFSPDCVMRLSAVLPDDLARTLNSLPFDQPFTSVYLGAHNPSRKPWSFYYSNELDNQLKTECFSIMATDRNRARCVRIDFQMPGKRYFAEHVTPQSARAFISVAIREAPLLASVYELWIVPEANMLLCEPCSRFTGFPNLTKLMLGLYAVASDTPEEVRHQWEPLRALEVRDEDPVIPCPRLDTLCVYVTTEEHVVDLYTTLLSRGEAGHPVLRLIVGFYHPPRQSLLELVEGLSGIVKSFTLLRHGEWCPDEFLWVHRLPPVCRDCSEHSFYWPAWA